MVVLRSVVVNNIHSVIAHVGWDAVDLHGAAGAREARCLLGACSGLTVVDMGGGQRQRR